MENQKLPNATTALVLSIVSFICCCFSMGIGGILLSGIALYLTVKDTKTYNENPELYSNFGNVRAAKILAIIGLVIGVGSLAFGLYTIVAAGGWAEYMEQNMEIYRQMGIIE